MRILHFIYDHPQNPWVGGGGARRVVRLAADLGRKGHQVDLVCGRYPCAKDYREGNVSTTFLGYDQRYVASTFSYALAAYRHARRAAANYDLVIEDFAPWNPVFTYRLRACPTVVQVQNRCGTQVLRRYPLVGFIFYALERSYPRRFAHAIVISPALNTLLGLEGEVISMGIEEDLLTLPESDGEYVACLGRLDFHQKGLDLLLRAAQATGLPVRIAGDGPVRHRLQARLPSAPSVAWDGPVEGATKVAFLRGARFVVVPSRFEGQSLVVLEAAALGKAVLTSEVPELAYAAEAGFALRFRTGAWPALADQMQRLWQEPDLRLTLAQRARPYVKDLTWPRISAHFERYCLRVIQARPPPARPARPGASGA